MILPRAFLQGIFFLLFINSVDRDHNEGFSQPSAANYGFSAAIYASREDQ
jgi:hypothetical protein